MAHPSIFCKVKGCRFAHFHTTVAHRCGLCNQYGHGQMECNSVQKKQNLIQYLEDTMPPYRRCEFANCTYPWSHASESHHCFVCGDRGTHSAPTCPVNHINNRHNERSGGASSSDPIYQENINNYVDLSGSASGSASKMPDTQNIEAIQNSTVSISLIYKQCPMCRESSNVDIHLKLFTDSPCVICTENNPKILFSGCKHANVCYKCVVQL
jgi:hypothetical protein